jgi:hypothetical protein
VKKTLCLILSLFLAVFASACANTAAPPTPTASPAAADPRDAQIAALEAQVADLKDEIAGLRENLEQEQDRSNEAWLNHCALLEFVVSEPESRLWLTTTDTKEYFSYSSEPLYGGTAAFQTGTLLEAFAELDYMDYGESEAGEPVAMLLVAHPVYGIPDVPVVWVRLEDCMPYTAANRYDITNPVTVRAGAKYFSYDDDNDEAIGIYDDALAGEKQIISRIDNGWAYLTGSAGWMARVAGDDVVYPDPETFTYCR